LEFQEEQPGMVNWTILSAAKARLEKENKKTTVNNIDNIFFIIYLLTISVLHDNSNMHKFAITICN